MIKPRRLDLQRKLRFSAASAFLFIVFWTILVGSIWNWLGGVAAFLLSYFIQGILTAVFWRGSNIRRQMNEAGESAAQKAWLWILTWPYYLWRQYKFAGNSRYFPDF